MGDWADEKAEHALCNLCNLIAVSRDDIAIIAAALRQARLDALGEARVAVIALIDRYPIDSWDDGFNAGVRSAEYAIDALKEKQ